MTVSGNVEKNKMKQLILILLLFLSYSELFSQSENLEPINESLILYNQPELKEYFASVNELLLNDLNPNALARVVVIPSFHEEYVLSIETDGGNFYFLKRTVDSAIWKNPNIDSIKTIDKRIKIGSDLTKKINHLFYSALSQTQYPIKPIIGLDGVTYYYSAFKELQGVKTGKTWSPTKGTKMADLVEITDLINKMIENNNSQISNLIIEKSETLIEKLEK